MQIAVTLDESEKIDPIDPIGNITITNDTTTITEKSTYLDPTIYCKLFAI